MSDLVSEIKSDLEFYSKHFPLPTRVIEMLTEAAAHIESLEAQLAKVQPQAAARDVPEGHEMCGGCMGTGTCTFCDGAGTLDARPTLASLRGIASLPEGMSSEDAVEESRRSWEP